MNNLYAKTTTSDQGLIIDEKTGETIALTYKAENAAALVDHIADLESTIRTLAKHLEAIQNIAEHDNSTDQSNLRAIRQHAEAFNLLETIDFITKE